jgi:hypothetical protein
MQMILDRIREHRGLRLRTNDPQEGVIEGLLARGDRRVADAVQRAWELGARFDGWHEIDTLPLWHQAFADTGVSLDWYCQRERDQHEALPWDHLDSGLDKDWLWQDWQDATSEKALDDCRWIPCYDCGVCPGLNLWHDTGYQAPAGSLPIMPAAAGRRPVAAHGGCTVGGLDAAAAGALHEARSGPVPVGP